MVKNRYKGLQFQIFSPFLPEIQERKRQYMQRERQIFYSVAHTSTLQTLYSDQMSLFQLGVCSALSER